MKDVQDENTGEQRDTCMRREAQKNVCSFIGVRMYYVCEDSHDDDDDDDDNDNDDDDDENVGQNPSIIFFSLLSYRSR